MYSIIHTNVDGAGSGYPTFNTLREAVAEAKRLQAQSDDRGNPWSYRYHVYYRGIKAYSTFSRPRDLETNCYGRDCDGVLADWARNR